MRVTSVRLGRSPDADVLAVCSFAVVSADEKLKFVVRGVRLIRVPNERNIVLAFPSHRRLFPCPNCERGNRSDAVYCNFCGDGLTSPEDDGEPTSDMIYPADQITRGMVEAAIFRAYSQWEPNR